MILYDITGLLRASSSVCARMCRSMFSCSPKPFSIHHTGVLRSGLALSLRLERLQLRSEPAHELVTPLRQARRVDKRTCGI